jgi:hypothetical protein
MRKDFIAQTLKFLSWKKSVIATLLTLVLWYCFAKWYLDEATYNLIGWMLVIVFWWASIATKNIYSVNK